MVNFQNAGNIVRALEKDATGATYSIRARNRSAASAAKEMRSAQGNVITNDASRDGKTCEIEHNRTAYKS